MTNITRKLVPGLCLVVAGWGANGEITSTLEVRVVAVAHAVVGAPVTPVSVAGVARRSTVGVGAPGVGVAPRVGVGTPGVGVAPGNRGGPVNRVGVR